MAVTEVIGTSSQGSISPAKLAVDPLFLAARVALRPLDYSGAGRLLGHYRAAGSTSAIAPASGILSNFRFTDPGSFAVILGVRVGISVVTTVTAQRTDPILLFMRRAYTVNETTNLTALTLSGNNQKMRTIMGTTNAQIGVTSAAAGLSGGTSTADANSIGIASISPALVTLGTGMPMVDLYRALTHGGHPPVLAVNEGLSINWGATTLATGTVTVQVEYEWAEVIVF